MKRLLRRFLISFGEEKRDIQMLKVDSIIICAGQTSEIS